MGKVVVETTATGFQLKGISRDSGFNTSMKGRRARDFDPTGLGFDSLPSLQSRQGATQVTRSNLEQFGCTQISNATLGGITAGHNRPLRVLDELAPFPVLQRR